MRIGDKVRIIRMDGEPEYDGKKGIITRIDDAGQIHGTWGGCALIPGVDEYEVTDTTGIKAIFGVIGTYLFLYGMLDVMEMVFGVVIR